MVDILFPPADSPAGMAARPSSVLRRPCTAPLVRKRAYVRTGSAIRRAEDCPGRMLRCSGVNQSSSVPSAAAARCPSPQAKVATSPEAGRVRRYFPAGRERHGSARGLGQQRNSKRLEASRKEGRRAPRGLGDGQAISEIHAQERGAGQADLEPAAPGDQESFVIQGPRGQSQSQQVARATPLLSPQSAVDVGRAVRASSRNPRVTTGASVGKKNVDATIPRPGRFVGALRVHLAARSRRHLLPTKSAVEKEYLYSVGAASTEN